MSKQEINSETRRDGTRALDTVLKMSSNVRIIEKYVYLSSKTEEAYRKAIFQVVGDVINRKKLKIILNDIKSGFLGRNHPVFSEARKDVEEHDDFIVNPFEVEEGVTECNKCGSNRVLTYSVQSRSCDEPMSTVAQCTKCKNNWTYSG